MAPGDKRAAGEKDAIVAREDLLVEAVIRGTHLHQVLLRGKSGLGDAECFGGHGLGPSEMARLSRDYGTILAAGPEGVAGWVKNGREAAPQVDAAVLSLNSAGINLSACLPVSLATGFVRARASNSCEGGIRSVPSLYQMIFEGDRDADAVQTLFAIYLAVGLPVHLDDLGISCDTEEFVAMAEELAPKTCRAPFDTDAAAWHIASRKIRNWGQQHSGKITAATYAAELLALPEVAECIPVFKKMPDSSLAIIGHSFTMSLHWASHGSFTDIAREVIASCNDKIRWTHVSRGGLDVETALGDAYLGSALEAGPEKTLLVLVVRGDRQIPALRTLIRRLRNSGSEVYMFDSIAPMGNSLTGYGKNIVRAARDAGATIIEVGRFLEEHPLRDEFLCLDGTHMNPAYHKVMAVEWLRFLAGMRAARLPEGG